MAIPCKILTLEDCKEEELSTVEVLILPIERKKEKIIKLYAAGILSREALEKHLMVAGGLFSSYYPRFLKIADIAKQKKIQIAGIEGDVDSIIEAVRGKIKEGRNRKVLQEARLWLISNEGPVERFLRKIDRLLKPLPGGLRQLLVNFISGIYGFIVNIIPGDQLDAVAAVNAAREIICKEIVRKATRYCREGLQVGIVIPGSIKNCVEERILEKV